MTRTGPSPAISALRNAAARPTRRGSPMEQSSTTVTRWPSATSRSSSAEPMNPAPP